MKKYLLVFLLILSPLWAQEIAEQPMESGEVTAAVIDYKVKILNMQEVGDMIRIDMVVLDKDGNTDSKVMTFTVQTKEATVEKIEESVLYQAKNYKEETTVDVESIKQELVGKVYSVEKESAK